MNGNLVRLASQHRGRPLLMLPRAAEELALRLHSIDADAFARPNRLGALLRKLSGARTDANAVRTPQAMDDDGWTPVPPERREAYAPRWLGEPEDYGYFWTLNQGVALMRCDTPLLAQGEYVCGEYHHGYDTLLAGLSDAAADSRVQATFLKLSTPGGVVDPGIQELAAWMRENRAAAGGKPIWIWASMACSAGYWIMAQGDRGLAGRVSLVGSVGAVIVHENHSGALDKAGVELTPIEFPEGKTDGAWWNALSASAREDLRSEIKQCAMDFCADLEAGRPNLTTEFLLGLKARVFMGHNDDAARSAKDLGLVDDLMGETAAFQALLDHLSASRTAGTIPAAAPGRGAKAQSPTEEPMAVRPQPTAGRPAAQTPAQKALADAHAAVAKANADLARAQAAAAAAPDPDADEDDDTDEVADRLPDDGDDEDEQPDAAAIAASPEAKAHPALALAAIQSGQTLAQFKANVAAAQPAAQAPTPSAQGRPRGALDRYMTQHGGKPARVGPDATVQAKPQRSARDDNKRNVQAGLESARRR